MGCHAGTIYSRMAFEVMCVWPLKLVTCSMWCALLRHPSSMRIEKTLSPSSTEKKNQANWFLMDWYLCSNVHVCNCQDSGSNSARFLSLIFNESGKVSLCHISGGNSNRLLLHKSAGSDKEDPTCFGILEILLAFSPYQFCLKPLLLRSSSRRTRGRLNLPIFWGKNFEFVDFLLKTKTSLCF